MGMIDSSLIHIINPTFIPLTASAIHHCLSAWKTSEFRVAPKFGPGSGAQCKCDARNIKHAVNNACTDVFHRFDANFLSSSPKVQAKKRVTIRSMIRRRIHSTGMDPAMAQPNNDQGSFDEKFLVHVPEEQFEQPDKSFNHCKSFVAATEASMQFSAVQPMGGSAIASSSEPIPCSSTNNNCNNITNMTRVENTGLVDGSPIVEGVMLLGA